MRLAHAGHLQFTKNPVAFPGFSRGFVDVAQVAAQGLISHAVHPGEQGLFDLVAILVQHLDGHTQRFQFRADFRHVADHDDGDADNGAGGAA